MRRPPGDDVYDVRDGTWYRTPVYKQGHLARPDGDAWCGRALFLPDHWWTESGWEEELGVWWLVEDQRTTEKCTPCKNKRDAFRAAGLQWEYTPPPDPWDADLRPKVEAAVAFEEVKMRQLAAYVAASFGGEVQ